jgi:hypothetical protein
MKWSKLALVMGLFFVGNSLAEASVKGLCQFDTASLRFRGSATEQTTCLMRFVRPQGSGSTVQPIPDVLKSRVGLVPDISIDHLKACLSSANIALSEVSGTPVVSTKTKKLVYFVLHDTSSPEYAQSAGFPANINDAAWSGNNLNSGHSGLVSRVQFVINRVGRSRATTLLGEPRAKPATKLEMNSQVGASRPLFVHVENIMPRLKPPGSWAHIPPIPAFTDAMLERLAWLYVVSSVRAERWLIPAQHFNIDSNLFPGVDVHDDPQAFDLPKWGVKIAKVIEDCKP